MNHSKVDQKERDSRKHYRVIADRDKGDEPDGFDINDGDRVTYEYGTRTRRVRIERPVPTPDEPPVTDTSSGEHRRVIRHVGDDLPICDTCINVLGLNVRWDHAVLRHEREGITPAEALPSPSLPTRDQIAWQKLRSLRDDLFESTDAAFEPDEVIEELDAVLALLQKGADREWPAADDGSDLTWRERNGADRG